MPSIISDHNIHKSHTYIQRIHAIGYAFKVNLCITPHQELQASMNWDLKAVLSCTCCIQQGGPKWNEGFFEAKIAYRETCIYVLNYRCWGCMCFEWILSVFKSIELLRDCLGGMLNRFFSIKRNKIDFEGSTKGNMLLVGCLREHLDLALDMRLSLQIFLNCFYWFPYT